LPPLRDGNSAQDDNLCKAHSAETLHADIGKRLWEFEFHRDLGLNGDGLVVEIIRLVFPLLDGIDRGVRQDRIATEQFHIGDAAILADVG